MDFIGKATAKIKTDSEQKNLPGISRWIPAVKGGPDQDLVDKMDNALIKLRENHTLNWRVRTKDLTKAMLNLRDESYINPLNHNDNIKKVMQDILELINVTEPNITKDEIDNYIISYKHVYKTNDDSGSGYFLAVPFVMMRNRTHKDNLDAIIKLWGKIEDKMSAAIVIVKERAVEAGKTIGEALGKGVGALLFGCMCVVDGVIFLGGKAWDGIRWIYKKCKELGVVVIRVFVALGKFLGKGVGLGIAAAMDLGTGLKNSSKTGRMQVSVATTAMETGLLYQLKYASNEAKCKLKGYLEDILTAGEVCDKLQPKQKISGVDVVDESRWKMKWDEDRNQKLFGMHRYNALRQPGSNFKDVMKGTRQTDEPTNSGPLGSGVPRPTVLQSWGQAPAEPRGLHAAADDDNPFLHMHDPGDKLIRGKIQSKLDELDKLHSTGDRQSGLGAFQASWVSDEDIEITHADLRELYNILIINEDELKKEENKQGYIDWAENELDIAGPVLKQNIGGDVAKGGRAEPKSAKPKSTKPKSKSAKPRSAKAKKA